MMYLWFVRLWNPTREPQPLHHFVLLVPTPLRAPCQLVIVVAAHRGIVAKPGVPNAHETSDWLRGSMEKSRCG